jgi:hypothetical protein
MKPEQLETERLRREGDQAQGGARRPKKADDLRTMPRAGVQWLR